MNTITTIKEIVQKLSHPHLREAQSHLTELQKKNITKIDELIENVSNETIDDDLRSFITWALGRLGNKKAVPKLQELLNHETNKKVKQEAIKSLGLLGDNSSRDTFVRIVTASNDDGLQTSAAYGLRLLATKQSYDNLLQIATNETVDDKIRSIAIDALSDVNSDYEEFVSNLLPLLNDKSPDIRFATAYTIGHIGSHSHIDKLSSLTLDKTVIVGLGSISEIAQQSIEMIENKQNNYYWGLENSDTT